MLGLSLPLRAARRRDPDGASYRASSLALTLAARRTERPDVDVLARDLGFETHAVEMPYRLAGLIVPARTIRLVVNAHHRPERRRLTTAHQIGHLLLHRDLVATHGCSDGLSHRQIADAPCRSPDLDEEHERRADEFAADLLAPIPTLRRLHDDERLDATAIARRLACPEAMIEGRLEMIRSNSTGIERCTTNPPSPSAPRT